MTCGEKQEIQYHRYLTVFTSGSQKNVRDRGTREIRDTMG